MGDEEHSDSELYYREEQETAEECYVAAVGILTKLHAREDTRMKS